MATPHSLLASLLLLAALLLALPPPSLQLRIAAADLAALLAVKNSLTDLPGAAFFSSWDFAAPDSCSSFAGVTCSPSGRVTALSLGSGGLSGSPGLAGSLSPSLARLTELTQLILSPGIVTGPIPPQLGRLPGLRVLSLTNNRLTGPIPASLAALPGLHTLDLSYNQLAGTIPPGLPAVPGLKVLILASNRLFGRVPPVSARVLHLDLRKNRLFGPVPPLPPTLRYLSFCGNAMWGPLNGLASLSELVYLDLSMNRFGGPIPPSLFFTPTLQSMLLQRNNLSGGVPASAGSSATSYGPGSIVDLSHNALTGELSTALVGVESLYLNNNRLTGSVPEEYAKSVFQGRTRTLYLQHNYISGFPWDRRMAVPDTTAVCLSYNCMVPPVGLEGCPASAGSQLSRPASQCSAFRGGGESPRD
ncbi:leucine-rich repeat receptor-like kinase protein THICK TASSEL DWARF1 [Rhodamnia argentea]|uniref:Leucine-rich repeat receptor-like kinase protein THICK TASSEL DWARF1 n=1 Tax=Rhodamnia argentea TaxID=178133 RepID=A0A8B8QHQ3_9MYRT|nr:leucine-rich repeat receptor-like kinase protein THICK TASSEL DWARF1 [Rhodamnia argentea]